MRNFPKKLRSAQTGRGDKRLDPLRRLVLLLVAVLAAAAARGDEVFPGADEKTPSLCMYFDWINSQYEGTTEAQTLANMDFFQWMHDEYGMILDIYSLDVGNVDDGPYTAGVGRLIPDHHGTLASIEFRRQFPRGFAPLRDRARGFGCRLGIWLGPDGFGDTPEQEEARRDMLVALCRDHDFRLFKFDAVAGDLPARKQDALIRTLIECRKHCPDLIALNERITLGRAAPYFTTNLWEGAETYIDVFCSNTRTAPHHRAGALSRGLTPGLGRLIEDHGVCLSSCLDYWEDDLVLQAFNRCLILAPEIYGSPWLLADDEFPKLARLCNLHRRFREILVNGLALPVGRYGPHAVSRGDERCRFITLRNLTWEPTTVRVKLDESIGLAPAGTVELRRFHPSERIIGSFPWNSEVAVEVAPFRSCLIAASTRPTGEVGVRGCDYEVIRDVKGKPVLIRLLGLPGTSAAIVLDAGGRRFTHATLDGEAADALVEEEELHVDFPGRPLAKAWHRKLGTLTACPVPGDAETLFEATCFAADSNALEVRSLHRSGPTRIPRVEAARAAFFNKPMFVRRGIRDRNLFDGDSDTCFAARHRGGLLRVDFGKPIRLDHVVIRFRDRQEPFISELHALAEENGAEISRDLVDWKPAGGWSGKGSSALISLPAGETVRYLRLRGAPIRVAEVEGYRGGEPVDRSAWRASNLFGEYGATPAVRAWSLSFRLDEIPEGSRLAVAIEGGQIEGRTTAALRAGADCLGAPDRAVSFPCNPWEYRNVDSRGNETYFLPLTQEMRGEELEAVVLLLEGGKDVSDPVLYLTAYPPPKRARQLELHEAR